MHSDIRSQVGQARVVLVHGIVLPRNVLRVDEVVAKTHHKVGGDINAAQRSSDVGIEKEGEGRRQHMFASTQKHR